MTEVQTLEQRVAALEREVALLRQQLTAKTDDNWLTRIAGTEVDDEALREAMEHGRVFRQADRPNRAAEPPPAPDLSDPAWKNRFDELLTLARGRSAAYPPGFQADVSRESIYDGCGE